MFNLFRHQTEVNLKPNWAYVKVSICLESMYVTIIIKSCFLFPKKLTSMNIAAAVATQNIGTRFNSGGLLRKPNAATKTNKKYIKQCLVDLGMNIIFGLFKSRCKEIWYIDYCNIYRNVLVALNT